MSRSKALWILFFVIIIGALLRSYQIMDRSLWFDEAFSWRLIQFPLVEMIERDIADVHPPLYYIILKGWSVVFGASLLSLRAFSVVSAGLTIAASYLLASAAWRSRAIGLTAASFIAFSGWQISFAWEARMYTLGTLAALLSTWFLIKAIRQSKFSILWWIGYGVSAAVFAYIHYFAFFTLAAHALFVAGYVLMATRGRIGEILHMKTTWYALVGALVATLIYLPWIPHFIAQNKQVQEGWWPETITRFTIPHTFYKMYIPLVSSPASQGFGTVLTLLPLGLTVAGWLLLIWLYRGKQFSSDKSLSDAAFLTVLCGAVPFVLAAVMSSVGQSIYQDRFLVFAQLFILIGLAALIWRIKIRYIPQAIVSAFILLFIWSFAGYLREIDIGNKPGALAATQYVVQNYNENEIVLVSSPFIYFAVEYYAKEELGGVINPRLYSQTGQLSHFSGGPILVEEDIAGQEYLDKVVSGEGVWVVDTTGFGGREMELSGRWRLDAREVFREVFPHQGDVIVNKYIKE